MGCVRQYSKLPTPQELKLPFDKWRPGQEELAHVIITSEKRFKVICAPTGFGKSLPIVASSLVKGVPTAIVTATRGLQDQYQKDFISCGMVDLRGKRNYKCEMRPDDPDYTCEEGHAARCLYKGSIGCPSSQAEMAAATSSLVVTNYDKWTSNRMYGQGLSHIQQVIFDEGDECPNALARAMQVVLNHREIEEGLHIDFPLFPACENMADWKAWAVSARADAEVAMLAAQARITGLVDPKPAWVKHYTHMRNLCRRLAVLATCRAADWVVGEIEGGFQFDPIRLGRYAETALLLKVPSVVVISATARPKTMFMIGVAKDQFIFKEFDSDFDPARCPIYYVPTMRVDSDADSMAPLWLLLDQIAARRRDRNGLVQTISYTRREDIVRNSRYASSMIFNERGASIADTVEEFRAQYPGKILVSPSVERGYDFKYKQAEWLFLAKIPFDPPSKILKAREADDPEYRAANAMRRMEQIFGRIMREKNDQGERFIGDKHLDWFLPRYRHLASKSFHRFFKPVNVLPQPPTRL
jgi:Rad3-related DNA helicase